MHLTSRRIFQLAAGLLVIAAPAFCASCTVLTPEPGTFWLAGVGAGAVLLVRRLRSKK
jgi:hypothetical protein